MRREGYEVAVSRPEVIFKKVDGKLQEPVEEVICSVPNEYSGTVINKLNLRKGQMIDIQDEGSYTRVIYHVPTRGLLGYRSEFINDTKGEGVMVRKFIEYVRYAECCNIPSIKPFDMMGIRDYIELGKNMADMPKVMKEYGKISCSDLGKRFKSPVLRRMMSDYLPGEYTAYSLLVSCRPGDRPVRGVSAGLPFQ